MNFNIRRFNANLTVVLYLLIIAFTFVVPRLAISQDTDILLVTKTEGYRHEIIPTGKEVIPQIGQEGGFEVTVTEDIGVFTNEGLADYAAIIFFSTSGEVLNDQQKVAFQEYIRGGGGFVAIHQGITTHQNWDWYLDMVGGGLKFGGHPEVQPGTLIIEDHDHPSTTHLPEEWKVTDEFYDFTVNPRSVTNVLMSLDESSYEGGGMGKDHPYAWYHEFEGGRVWCTGLGHTEEVVRSDAYKQHLMGGIRWAAGLEDVASGSQEQQDWWSASHSVRIPISVGAKGYNRFDVPAEVQINFTDMLSEVDTEGSLDPRSLRLVEVNDRGKVIDESVPFQFNRNNESGPLATASGTLVFNMEGRTDKSAVRHYQLYLGFDEGAGKQFGPASFRNRVSLSDDIYHRNQYNYKIVTRDHSGKPNATYYYHKQGAGFASMYDGDGNDWIDYSIAEGDSGEWRGIPNIGWDGLDEDPGFGHPGYTTGQSEIVHNGPVKMTIRSWSDNGKWEIYWEMYSAFTRLTVNEVPPGRPFWFLYEGRPGGEFADHDYFVRDDGSYSMIDENWSGNITWGYFASRDANRSLFLGHLTPDNREDSYYKLNSMTVFGFGRGSGDNSLDNLLTETPNKFVIGFAEGTEYDKVSKVVQSAMRGLSYEIGPAEEKELQ